MALLRDGIELVVASVGDSRAMLCRKGKALKLTDDHHPDRKDEKERYVLRLGLCSGVWVALGEEDDKIVLDSQPKGSGFDHSKPVVLTGCSLITCI